MDTIMTFAIVASFGVMIAYPYIVMVQIWLDEKSEAFAFGFEVLIGLLIGVLALHFVALQGWL